MTGIYWNSKGEHQSKVDLLQKLIPLEGEADGKALEQLRKAINCYYDLYNNGIGNRRAFYTMFVSEREYRVSREPNFTGEYREHLYDIVEEMMSDYILDAWEEQAANVLLHM